MGYTLAAFMIHIEKLFKPGMTWQNYGEWEIYHIIPQSLWNFTTSKDPEFKKCWALNNLQPLWSCNNKIKDTKLITIQ